MLDTLGPWILSVACVVLGMLLLLWASADR